VVEAIVCQLTTKGTKATKEKNPGTVLIHLDSELMVDVLGRPSTRGSHFSRSSLFDWRSRQSAMNATFFLVFLRVLCG